MSASTTKPTPVRRNSATAVASPLAYPVRVIDWSDQAPRLQVLAAVADEVEAEVVRLVDPLDAADDHAERVASRRPAEQGVLRPQGRSSTRRCSVRSVNISSALRPAHLVPGLGTAVTQVPADLARAAVRHADRSCSGTILRFAGPCSAAAPPAGTESRPRGPPHRTLDSGQVDHLGLPTGRGSPRHRISSRVRTRRRRSRRHPRGMVSNSPLKPLLRHRSSATVSSSSIRPWTWAVTSVAYSKIPVTSPSASRRLAHVVDE